MDFFLRDTGALDEREELATAARVALGTNKLADEDDILPDPDSTDRQGWWADLEAEQVWGGWPIGTKNWLLSRAKITEAPSEEGSTLERARQYTQEALQPLIDRRVASQVEVEATRSELHRIDVHAVIYRGPEAEIDLRYQLLWEEAEEAVEIPVTTLKRIGRANLKLTSEAPMISIFFRSWMASLGLHTTAPIMLRTDIRLPAHRDLALSEFTPSVVRGLGIIKAPSRRNALLDSTAPIARVNINKSAIFCELALSSTVPDVRIEGHVGVDCAILQLTSTAPLLTLGVPVAKDISGNNFVLTTTAPVISYKIRRLIGFRDLTFTSTAPSVNRYVNKVRLVPYRNLILSQRAPNVYKTETTPFSSYSDEWSTLNGSRVWWVPQGATQADVRMIGVGSAQALYAGANGGGYARSIINLAGISYLEGFMANDVWNYVRDNYGNQIVAVNISWGQGQFTHTGGGGGPNHGGGGAGSEADGQNGQDGGAGGWGDPPGGAGGTAGNYGQPYGGGSGYQGGLGGAGYVRITWS